VARAEKERLRQQEIAKRQALERLREDENASAARGEVGYSRMYQQGHAHALLNCRVEQDT
jgi:hypothetical protein